MNESKIVASTPDTPEETDPRDSNNDQQYPKWWNPRWWIGLGIFWFAVFVAALFIACRYWLGYPYDTPAFVAGVVGLLTLAAIVMQIFVSRMGLTKTDRLFNQNERMIWEMKEQRSLASLQAAQADERAIEARWQTTQMIRQADLMDVQGEIMRGQLEQIKEQTALTSKQMNDWVATEKAYIGLVDIKLVEQLAIDCDPQVKLRIINGGRTPAWHIIGSISSHLNERDTPQIILSQHVMPQIQPNEVVGQIGLLPSNAEDTFPVLQLKGLVTNWDSRFSDIVAGVLPFYVSGIIRYRDILGKNWKFRFISFYEPSVLEFIECGSETLPDDDINEEKGEQDN